MRGKQWERRNDSSPLEPARCENAEGPGSIGRLMETQERLRLLALFFFFISNAAAAESGMRSAADAERTRTGPQPPPSGRQG